MLRWKLEWLRIASQGGMSVNMFEYIWRVKTRLPERFLTRCKVVARGKLNSCLVEFEDGFRVVTSRNYLMRQETMQKKIALKRKA